MYCMRGVKKKGNQTTLGRHSMTESRDCYRGAGAAAGARRASGNARQSEDAEGKMSNHVRYGHSKSLLRSDINIPAESIIQVHHCQRCMWQQQHCPSHAVASRRSHFSLYRLASLFTITVRLPRIKREYGILFLHAR